MILDKLSAANAYRGIHPRLDGVLDRLNEAFLATVGPETMELEGDKLYVTRFTYETLPREETFFEAHKRYLDVHLMVQGEERVELASPGGLTLFEHQGDFYAYRGEAEQSLVLRPGSFLVVFPEDAHRIKIQVNGPETVSKVVFKVLVYEE
jgi:YhcH/YjgK/YiaL family protein